MPGSTETGRPQTRTDQAVCLFAPFETLVQFNKRPRTHMSQAKPLPRLFRPYFGTECKTGNGFPGPAFCDGTTRLPEREPGSRPTDVARAGHKGHSGQAIPDASLPR